MIHLIRIKPSSRPAKKLMAVFMIDGAPYTVHFGAAGYMDYIRYYARNPRVAKQKRAQYISRHRTGEQWQDPLSAGSLARYILWEKPTLPQAIRAFKARFKL
jgi:hypothetical protein